MHSADQQPLPRQARRWPSLRRLVVLGLACVVALVPLVLNAAGFTDLNVGSPHNDNISAIAAVGITKGCNPPDLTNYCPNDYVTREQMASFLARTAGLGSNPPVANASTAQSATHATTADTATNAPNAQAKYLRTVVVSPVGTATENGAALVAALNGIADASASKPYLLKLEPGNYQLSTSLTLKPHVDLEGSGEGITTILHDQATTVLAGDEMEVRGLTVTCQGTAGCVALRLNAGFPTFTHVTLRAISTSGDSTGLFIAHSGAPVGPLFQYSTIVASAGANGAATGLQFSTGSSGVALLTVRDSVIRADLDGQTRAGVRTSGTATAGIVIERTKIAATTNTIKGAQNALVRIAASYLVGGAAVAPGGLLVCAGVYNEDFTFFASTCP